MKKIIFLISCFILFFSTAKAVELPVEIEATSKCFIVNYTKGSDIGSNEDMKILRRCAYENMKRLC